MAHEIMENDNMISVHELPWHGLGIVLDDYPSIEEAQRLAGLDWTVRKEAVYYRTPQNDGMSRIIKVPDNFAIVRNDNNMPLGLVGNQYEPYQNDQMFAFMDQFMQQANSKIETCGSLRNGKIVWALAQAGAVEYVKNDPTIKYFLFKNAFDGSSTIEVCFTDIRVVCNNTLTAALKGSSNLWRIRHTGSMHEQLTAVQDAIAHQQSHAEAMREAMQKLTSVSMTGQQIQSAFTDMVLRSDRDLVELAEEEGKGLLELATNHQRRVVNCLLELHESGAGSDIPGVRGSAYGVLQAATEYADHYRIVRAGDRSLSEARFESVMMGSSHQFKTKAFDYVMSLAA